VKPFQLFKYIVFSLVRCCFQCNVVCISENGAMCNEYQINNLRNDESTMLHIFISTKNKHSLALFGTIFHTNQRVRSSCYQKFTTSALLIIPHFHLFVSNYLTLYVTWLIIRLHLTSCGGSVVCGDGNGGTKLTDFISRWMDWMDVTGCE